MYGKGSQILLDFTGEEDTIRHSALDIETELREASPKYKWMCRRKYQSDPFFIFPMQILSVAVLMLMFAQLGSRLFSDHLTGDQIIFLSGVISYSVVYTLQFFVSRLQRYFFPHASFLIGHEIQRQLSVDSHRKWIVYSTVGIVISSTIGMMVV